MKTWKLISLLLLVFSLGACDDETVAAADSSVSIDDNSTADINVSFVYESTSVLKNTSLQQIPIRLEKPAVNDMKITFATVNNDKNNSAREGIDFYLSEKVLTIPAGDTIGYIVVELIDTKVVNDDKIAVISITGVYGGKLGKKSVCSLHIMSNSFVEFEKNNWKTYESANFENEYAHTCKIPLKIRGTLTETATFDIVLTDSTAKESEHFEIVSKRIIVNPGDEVVYLELLPKDDYDVNKNRFFNIAINSTANTNLAVSKTNSTCEVLIISEEKVKTLSFTEQMLTMNEGEVKEIMITIDNPVTQGEADVRVSLVQKIGGNALLDTDYTLSIESLTFGVGETKKICKLDFANDPQWLVDREFILELNSPIGAELNKDAAEIGVIVKSDSYLNELTASYEIEEAVGGMLIPVSITKALSEEIVLSLKAIPISNAEEGAHYTLTNTSVTIPAGETTANFELNIGHGDEWIGTPKFKVEVTHADANKASKVISEVSLTQCAYRKFLGQWILSSTNHASMNSGIITVSSGENGEFFNKKYICDVGHDLSSSVAPDYPFRWRMSYEKSTGGINVVMCDKIHIGENYTRGGILVYISWTYYNNITTKLITTTWQDDNTLLWNSGGNYVCLSILKASDDTHTGSQYAWHRNNVKMTRVK